MATYKEAIKHPGIIGTFVGGLALAGYLMLGIGSCGKVSAHKYERAEKARTAATIKASQLETQLVREQDKVIRERTEVYGPGGTYRCEVTGQGVSSKANVGDNLVSIIKTQNDAIPLIRVAGPGPGPDPKNPEAEAAPAHPQNVSFTADYVIPTQDVFKVQDSRLRRMIANVPELSGFVDLPKQNAMLRDMVTRSGGQGVTYGGFEEFMSSDYPSKYKVQKQVKKQVQNVNVKHFFLTFSLPE
jgi:hypothetical protein